jgi:hypothetical protein
LVFRDNGTSGTQIEVLSGDLCIAHIGKVVLSAVAGRAVQWRWNFLIMAGPAGLEFHGYADTFEAAKAAVERNWQAWLTGGGTKGLRERSTGARVISDAMGQFDSTIEWMRKQVSITEEALD